MEEKQTVFKELMFMARNEIAMPEKEGVKREYAINLAKLMSKKIVWGSDLSKSLLRRQFYLCRKMKELEREN